MLGSKEEPCSEVERNRDENVENDVWGDKEEEETCYLNFLTVISLVCF